MSRLLIAAFLLVLISTTLAGAQELERTKPGRERVRGVEQVILQIERETMAAIKERDAQTLSRILADDFIYRNPAGPDLTKAEFLHLVADLSVKILSIWGDGLKVKVYGRTAVLTGVQRSRAQGADGHDETGAQAFTDIFVRRKGRWLLVLAHSVDMLAAESESTPQLPSRK
jgi:ketosteroid isomerase-like protein